MDPKKVPPFTKKKVARRTKVALWLVLGPTILIAMTVIAFGITNLAFNSVPDSAPAACTETTDTSSLFGGASTNTECKEQLFGDQSAANVVINVILFSIGALGVATWLPGMIVGVVLLVSKPKTPSSPAQ